MLTEDEIIEIKKRTKNPDPTKKWGDTIAFAQELIKEIEWRNDIKIGDVVEVVEPLLQFGNEGVPIAVPGKRLIVKQFFSKISVYPIEVSYENPLEGSSFCVKLNEIRKIR